MDHQNIIELNGKRYDALTGALIGKSSAPIVPARLDMPRRTIDGVVRPSAPTVVKPSAPAKPTALHHEAAKPKAGAKRKIHVRDHAAPSAKGHQPEHSKTLMRHVVRKPEVTKKPAAKVQPKAEIAAKPMSALTVKRSGYQIDQRRMEHAKAISKHEAVHHFRSTLADAPVHKLTTHVAHLEVKPAPAQTQHVEHRPKTHTDIFEAAIAKANSHEQPAHKHPRSRRRKLANTMAVIGAFLVIGGFIGYLNMPNLELKVASIQAGFGAQLPGYEPTGFALRNGVERSGNTVSMTYQSGDQSYTITQQPSSWNSQTLAENTMALGEDHEKIQVDGRTVYVYGGNSAVWVDGGVRYDITGNARLNNEDLTAIAASL